MCGPRIDAPRRQRRLGDQPPASRLRAADPPIVFKTFRRTDSAQLIIVDAGSTAMVSGGPRRVSVFASGWLRSVDVAAARNIDAFAPARHEAFTKSMSRVSTRHADRGTLAAIDPRSSTMGLQATADRQVNMVARAVVNGGSARIGARSGDDAVAVGPRRAARSSGGRCSR